MNRFIKSVDLKRQIVILIRVPMPQFESECADRFAGYYRNLISSKVQRFARTSGHFIIISLSCAILHWRARFVCWWSAMVLNLWRSIVEVLFMWG